MYDFSVVLVVCTRQQWRGIESRFAQSYRNRFETMQARRRRRCFHRRSASAMIAKSRTTLVMRGAQE
jgi:hypothetical protein